MNEYDHKNIPDSERIHGKRSKKIRKGAKISLTATVYRYIPHLYESVFYTESDKLFKNGIG